jgi:uncharacterized protein (TIGR03000 family)
MSGLTRRFAIAGAMAVLIGLAGVRETQAQHRGGGGRVVHSGGGSTQFSGGSFHGSTGMTQTFSAGRQFSAVPTFSIGPRFVGGNGFIAQPFFFGGGPSFNSPFVSNGNFGGSFPGSFGVPYSAVPYSSSQYYAATSPYRTPSYSSAPASTGNASIADAPNANAANSISTVSYGTDDSRGDTAALNIQLPANASLFFNGVETKGQIGGRTRHYVTPPLSPGETYKFVLRAEWMEDGRMVERTREVKVEAGDVIRVDLGAQAS